MSTQGENDTASPVKETPTAEGAPAVSPPQTLFLEVSTLDPLERRKAWLKKLTEELLKLEGLFPVQNFLENPGLPQWVHNLERELGVTMFPIARLNEELDVSPKRIGGLIGHCCAYAVWMMEYLEEVITGEGDKDVIELTPEETALIEKFLSDLIGWYAQLRRFAKRALCSSVDQTYEDMREFLLGYSQAFARKPTTTNASEFGTSATQIYFFMFMWWRVVNLMGSVPELYEWLAKAFHPQRIGDLKRIEKICQRIGLRYRKRGRPPEPK